MVELALTDARAEDKVLTGVPLNQNAVLNACSRLVHQFPVTITKTGPMMLSTSPRKKRAAIIPEKLVQRASYRSV